MHVAVEDVAENVGGCLHCLDRERPRPRRPQQRHVLPARGEADGAASHRPVRAVTDSENVDSGASDVAADATRVERRDCGSAVTGDERSRVR